MFIVGALQLSLQLVITFGINFENNERDLSIDIIIIGMPEAYTTENERIPYGNVVVNENIYRIHAVNRIVCAQKK